MLKLVVAMILLAAAGPACAQKTLPPPELPALNMECKEAKTLGFKWRQGGWKPEQYPLDTWIVTKKLDIIAGKVNPCDLLFKPKQRDPDEYSVVYFGCYELWNKRENNLAQHWCSEEATPDKGVWVRRVVRCEGEGSWSFKFLPDGVFFYERSPGLAQSSDFMNESTKQSHGVCTSAPAPAQ